MQARRTRIAVLGTSLAAMLGLGGIRSASAAVLFDTTGLGGTSTYVAALGNYNPLGDSFLATSSSTLTGVTVDLMRSGAANGGFQIYLEQNSGGSATPKPNGTGAIFLGQVYDTALSATVITPITLSVSQALSSNTRYWIVLSFGGKGASTAAEWVYGANLPASSSVEFGEYRYVGGTTSPNNTLAPFQMLLTDTVATQGGASVPEPATPLLMGLPLLGLYFSRKRRRAS